jgi:uncharacterized protein (TIGR04255 family)
MVLDVGHPRQPLLKRAPLVLAVCQLRFPLVLGFSDELVRPLQMALASDFPDVEVQDLQQVEFGADGITVTGQHQRLYRFQTHAKDWVLSVGPTALALETTAYEGFDDLITRWECVARAAIETLKLGHQERLGLRYVNELSAPADATREDLLALVREELVGPIGTHERTGQLLKSWQELRFAQDDGSCTMQHGYAQRPQNGWAYVLDFDYYDDRGTTIELETQMRVLAQFNHRTFELFQWAVNEQQFSAFEPETRTDHES